MTIKCTRSVSSIKCVKCDQLAEDKPLTPGVSMCGHPLDFRTQTSFSLLQPVTRPAPNFTLKTAHFHCHVATPSGSRQCACHTDPGPVVWFPPAV